MPSPVPDEAPIATPRLELALMSVPFIEALAERDFPTAERLIGASVPPWLADELEDALKIWIARLTSDPSAAPWMARVMVLTEDGARRVVGSIGFHGPPDAEGRLEVGYSVDPPYRRRGFARESVVALFDWAHQRAGIERFVASISPANAPSLALARGLGFVQVGEQLDEVDGPEYVLETTWPRLPSEVHGEGT
jgi:RimJ/RimL family protein N-acetyltransferase